MLEVLGLSPLLSSIVNSGPPYVSLPVELLRLLLTDFFGHLHMLKIDERFGFTGLAFDSLAVEEPWSTGWNSSSQLSPAPPARMSYLKLRTELFF